LSSIISAEESILISKGSLVKGLYVQVDKLNSEGVLFFNRQNYEKAVIFFKEGLNLTKNIKDQKRGIFNFNIALTLHKMRNYKEANAYFYFACKYAQGNITILESKLLHHYECGLNPSISCQESPPLELNIEGSH